MALLTSNSVKLVAEEAADVCQDAAGRWYAFSPCTSTIILVEKKHVPSHLAALPCIDSPTRLSDVILQLEDAGEVLGLAKM